MSNETQSDNGSKFNGIERLFVVKQEANTQSAAADSQLQVAALNVRGTSSNGASAQPAHSSGIAGPPNSPVPHGDETSASAAFSPVTIDSDLLVPALAASVGNENAAITNSLQGAPARETGSKGDLPVASVASDHPAASGPRHQAISSQNPGADTNDTRDNQQDTEQSPGPQTHAEMLPPSADAVHPPVSNASGSISLEGPTSTAASQNLERYHVVEQVTRHLDSLRLKNGHGDITLNLMPAHLGSVKVTISTSEHGVVARVLVETSQAQQAMESAKDSLRSALESRGLNLSSLDVSLGQNMPGDSWGNFARQQERAREATERIAGRDYNRSGAADTVPEVVAAAGILNRATGSSRLDYRA